MKMKLPYINKNILFMIGTIAVLAAIAIYYTVPMWGAEGFAGSPEKVFYMVYADWCPHCQKIKPDFKQFMGDGSLNVNGKTVRVDMVQPEKEPEKVAGVDVKGYPTFLYSDANGRVVEYSGPRTSDGFMEFLKTQILS